MNAIDAWQWIDPGIKSKKVSCITTINPAEIQLGVDTKLCGAASTTPHLVEVIAIFHVIAIPINGVGMTDTEGVADFMEDDVFTPPAQPDRTASAPGGARAQTGVYPYDASVIVAYVESEFRRLVSRCRLDEAETIERVIKGGHPFVREWQRQHRGVDRRQRHATFGCFDEATGRPFHICLCIAKACG